MKSQEWHVKSDIKSDKLSVTSPERQVNSEQCTCDMSRLACQEWQVKSDRSRVTCQEGQWEYVKSRLTS